MTETIDQLSILSFTKDEQSLLDKVRSYDKSYKYLHQIPLAIEFSKTAHTGQKRASGEDYFIHPLAVAHTLASIGMDSLTIIAALLHDVVEDTEVSLEKVREVFGIEVASLVDGVTKLTKVEVKDTNHSKTENFRKLIVATSKDIRALIIKLADRLHNMQTISYVKDMTKSGRIALETMEIYAPIAERIGMHGIKSQLEDLSFAVLYQSRRDAIVQRLERLKMADSAKLVKNISDTLLSLLQDNDVEVQIIGREKTPFSIWEKMQKKNISFEQLSDVMAFRIVVPDVLSCYKALGLIHSNYSIVPGQFKDFISMPKQNRYKSIHTVVQGPEKQKIEIQIRTAEMHNIAENGIAAHWSYKQEYEEEDKEGYNWIRGLLNLSETSQSYAELADNTKLDIYTSQVFCFTPKGQVISLPKGASTIDFAYAVHSDLGNACIGARVNFKIAPLKTKLQNGDQVEIITSIHHNPSPNWECFAITGKALHEIRRITKQDRERNLLDIGQSLLTKVFTRQSQNFAVEDLESHLVLFNKTSVNDLLCSVGEGQITPESIFKAMHPTVTFYAAISHSIYDRQKKKLPTTDDELPIKGLPTGMNAHFGPCCCPIPGDRIVGIIVSNKGITIHTLSCDILQHYGDDPNIWVDMAWDHHTTSQTFTGSINVILQNIPGALAEVVSEIAKSEANISNVKILSREPDFFEVNFHVETKGIKHLTNIIAALRAKECVQFASRA